MINWLKFYFLGFFNDKYVKEGTTRNFFNIVLSLLLVVMLLSGGISVGFAMSYNIHYKSAEDFRTFLYAVFANEESPRIELKIQDGKLLATIPNAERINAFLDDNDYSINGYKLIIDTSPADTTFDDFTLECKDANGVELSYEEFKKLPEKGRNNGTINFKYSGKPLNIAQKQGEYIEYLEKISDEKNSEYNGEGAKLYGELKHRKIQEEISQQDYEIEIYTLYAKYYYPSYSRIETYGKAPTLRTYYTQPSLIENAQKYLILLNDTLICSFTTKNGVNVDFASYYMNMPDYTILSRDMSENAAKISIDSFIAKCFNSGGGLIFFVYIINTCGIMLFVIFIILILALILFIVSKLRLMELAPKYFIAVKIVCSYLLYSALFAFILAIILSFFYARGVVFTAIEIAFICLLTLRTLTLLVMEIIRTNNLFKKSNGGN